MGVYVDGEQIPRKPLFLNFDAGGGQNVIADYQSLFSGIGKLSQDTGNPRWSVARAFPPKCLSKLRVLGHRQK